MKHIALCGALAVLLAALLAAVSAVEPQAARLNTIEVASRIPINFFMCVVPPCCVCINSKNAFHFVGTCRKSTHFVTLHDPL